MSAIPRKLSASASTVRLVNMILLNAVRKGATEIRIEPQEKCVLVSWERDGKCIEEMRFNRQTREDVTARLKAMSQIDPASRERQEGKFRLAISEKEMWNFHITVEPVGREENVTIRIHPQS